MGRTPAAEWPALFNPFGGGIVHMNTIGDDMLLYRRTTLHDAEIKALGGGADVTLLPAPPDGQINLPLFVFINSRIITPYGNIDPDAYGAVLCPQVGTDAEWSQYLVNSTVFSKDILTQLLTTIRLVPLTIMSNYQDGAALDDWGVMPRPHFSSAPPVYHHEIWQFYISNNGAGDLNGGHADNLLVFDTLYVNLPQAWQ